MNPYSYDIQTLERKARAVRRHIVRLNANSPAGGHTGADLSQVELLTALYFRILNVAPDRLHDDDRDIYIQLCTRQISQNPYPIRVLPS